MSHVDPFPRVRLFDLDFVDAPSVQSLADVLCTLTPSGADAAARTVPLVITPNVDQMVKRNRRTDETATRLADRAQYVLADGQPIVWASRLMGRPLRTRLAGSSFIASMWPRIIAAERRVVVVAGSPVTADRIRREGPTIHAIDAPMLDLGRPDEVAEFVETCVDVAVSVDAEFVFVTLGYPKQCNVIDGMLRRWPATRPLPLFLAVGASFDMYYGLVRRAPDVVQRMGLEWLFRLIQEPRRLSRRYLVDDPFFAPMVVREFRAARRLQR